MKSKSFTDEQIIGILKQAQAGIKVVDLYRMHGLSDVTFLTGALNLAAWKFLMQNT